MLSLDEITDRIQKSHNSEDYHAVMELLENHWLAVWFGFTPEELRPILGSLIRAGLDKNGSARQLLLFLAPEASQAPETKMTSGVATHPNPALASLRYVGNMMQLRLRGQVTEASDSLERAQMGNGSVNPLFDTSEGWNLFLAVQSGITALLAGEFKRALNHFAAAQFHVLVPTLSFLNRDAYVKSALVHAAFGDTDEARHSLAQGARIPRTTSWTEFHIDANVALVQVLLEQDGKKAAKLLSSIPLRDIGELWPFYLVALQRVLDQTGRAHELEERISALEEIPFPRIEGDGFNGSVFALIRATIAMNQGDLEDARMFLALADQNFVGTQSITANMQLRDGRPRQAVEVIGENVPSTGLRRIDLWKHAALVQGYLTLGLETQALESLTAASEFMGEIRAEDLNHFSPSVREFGSKNLDSWPKEPSSVASRAKISTSAESAPLTERELQVLTMLSRGMNRKEIAQKLFVSINTLKTHLSAIYKKLGVSNRAGALQKAGQEDLI